jgi:hypothetical protein
MPGPDGYGSEHGLPLGSEVVLNVGLVCAGALPDHGANDALAVYAPRAGGVPSGAFDLPKK